MIIAFDYDGTISADLKMFSKIMRIVEESGHEPIIVTMRHYYEEDNILNMFSNGLGNGVRVFYTGRKAKKEFMKNTWNIDPDIWIDDNPRWILKDSM